MPAARSGFSWIALLAFAGLAACGAPEAKAPRPALVLTGRIVDEADLLPPTLEAKLTTVLAALEQDQGPQFVIATTRNLQGRRIEDYSIDLARAWGIGSAQRHDGVVLLVAPRERKVRIEVGTGLEKRLPDEFCAKVIRETIVPAFQRGDFPGGIERGAGALIEQMRRTPVASLGLFPQRPRMAA